MLTKMELTERQKFVIDCKEKFVWAPGYRGDGKSCVGSAWMLDRLKDGGVGVIAAVTYNQLHCATLPVFLERLQETGMDYYLFKTPPEHLRVRRLSSYKDVITLGNGAIIHVGALDRGFGRGIEANYAWLDETARSTKDNYDVLVGCLRGRGEKQMLVTTSPSDSALWTFTTFYDDHMLVRDDHAVVHL